MTDVFAIQDEISRGIANQLRLNLGRGRWRYETSVEAYDLYLRARALSLRDGFPPGIVRSIELFEQTIAKDPAFAPAYTAVATAYAIRSVQFPLDHPPTELLTMRTAAEKAIELDPLLPEAKASIYPNEQVLIFAGLGDKDRTFEALNRMAALGPQRVSLYLAGPELALLRGDSRLDLFRQKLGFRTGGPLAIDHDDAIDRPRHGGE